MWVRIQSVCTNSKCMYAFNNAQYQIQIRIKKFRNKWISGNNVFNKCVVTIDWRDRTSWGYSGLVPFSLPFHDTPYVTLLSETFLFPLAPSTATMTRIELYWGKGICHNLCINLCNCNIEAYTYWGKIMLIIAFIHFKSSWLDCLKSQHFPC